MQMNESVKQAFVKALPIIGSYLFVSMAYGLLMQEAGYTWIWSLFISMTVYTGAFQFVLVTFLSSPVSVFTVVITALFMNSRQFFYGLTFVEDFKKMGKRFPYMVHTMTDETYAVNCSMLERKSTETREEEKRRLDIMFWVALFSRIAWMIGAVAGGILGQVIPVKLEGIEFCMTALFVTIFIDQWKAERSHVPALLGLVLGIIFLWIAGPDLFLLPTLIFVSGFLLLLEKQIERLEPEKEGQEEKNE